jgi:hypothetical protein
MLERSKYVSLASLVNLHVVNTQSSPRRRLGVGENPHLPNCCARNV